MKGTPALVCKREEAAGGSGDKRQHGSWQVGDGQAHQALIPF